MDNKINHNRINKAGFQGIKPNSKEVKSMEELIKKMVNNLLVRAEREVPEFGDFKIVEERFKNIDKDLFVDEFWLEIMQPPKGVENYQKKRGLKFVASKSNGAEVEILIEVGSKDDILAKLKDESLIERLKNNTQKLSYGLQDL